MQTRDNDNKKQAAEEKREPELENVMGNLFIAEYQVDRLKTRLADSFYGYRPRMSNNNKASTHNNRYLLRLKIASCGIFYLFVKTVTVKNNVTHISLSCQKIRKMLHLLCIQRKDRTYKTIKVLINNRQILILVKTAVRSSLAQKN